MTKLWRTVLVILLVCILGGLAWAVLRGPQVADPVYQGKHLSKWIYESDFPTSLNEEATKAVRAMGTNAVPYLLYELAAEDSKLKDMLIDLEEKGWLGKYSTLSASERSQAAIRGILVLGKDALPVAMQGLTNADGRYRLGSEVALTVIDESSPAITQALLDRLNDDYEPARTQAAIALAVLGQNQEVIVPAVTRLLDDRNENVRHAAAIALGNCGAKAKPAIPKLLGMLAKTNAPNNIFVIEYAIKQIDPQAAAKAGIK